MYSASLSMQERGFMLFTRSYDVESSKGYKIYSDETLKKYRKSYTLSGRVIYLVSVYGAR